LKVLLDECLPRKLARAMTGHEVRTVPHMGWAGLKNGALMAAAAPRFDVLVTADRNLAFQQPAHDLPISVVVLVAATNRLADLLPLVPDLLLALADLPRGQLRRVGPLDTKGEVAH
jgi:hypothetical protein